MQSGVYILLATHNGEPFLAEQIESLQNQTLRDWTLLIRDDGSSDRSRNIANDFASEDTRIEVIETDAGEVVGPVRNFGFLLETAFNRGAWYVFTCDQDDVWRADKLEVMLNRMRAVEGDGTAPTLLHHDLEVVNGQLVPEVDSFWASMRISPGDEREPERLLSRNEVTGCALVCNRALLELALPIPRLAIMHDWWLALCAAYLGILQCVPDTLLKYRQHEANVIGAKSFWSGLASPGKWRQVWRQGNRELVDTVVQAALFQERFRDRLQPEVALKLNAYCQILQAGRTGRLRALLRAKVWRKQVFLDATLVARVLTSKAIA